MEGASEASMREDLAKKKRSLEIQKRLDILEEKIKAFKGWSQLSEAKKERSRAYRRAIAEAEYDRLGSGWDDEELPKVEEDEAQLVTKYRDNWIWRRLYSFEETTIIPPMPFWNDPSPPPEAKPRTTIQVFSAKIVGLRGGLQFPLDVHGTIAARDSADRRRNIIFNRGRDNCQTVTEQDPYLILTGPSRAILLLDPVIMEVMLYVKGAVECEDKVLNFEAAELTQIDTVLSRMINRCYTSKLSTLDLALGSVVSSVEGVVTIRVTNVSLPRVFLVTVCTNNSKPSWRGSGLEDTDSKKIVLLDSRHTSEPVDSSGHINLSRCIVSARVKGNLIVYMEAPVEHSKENMVFMEMSLPALEKGFPTARLNYGSGTIEVGVAWSLIAASSDLFESSCN